MRTFLFNGSISCKIVYLFSFLLLWYLIPDVLILRALTKYSDIAVLEIKATLVFELNYETILRPGASD